MDYASLLYGPIYDVLGVPATLTLPGTDGDVIELTALDKTAGVTVGNSIEVQSVEPAAIVRRSEMSEVVLSTLRGATITLNDKTWEVRGHMLKPSPKGEADGEVYLLLTETD